MTMSWRTGTGSSLDERGGAAGSAALSSNSALMMDDDDKTDLHPTACESTTASSSSAASSPIGGDEDMETSIVHQQQHQQSLVAATGKLAMSSSSSSPQDMVVGGSSSEDPGGSTLGDSPYTSTYNSSDSQQFSNGNHTGGGNDDRAVDGGPLDDDDDDDDGGDANNQQQQHPHGGGSAGNDSSSTRNNKPRDEVVVDDGDSSDQDVPWSPQEAQSVCEFTHIIEDYSHKRDSGCKKAEYSATTVDDHGNRWRLIIYVNGNGRASNHHLSLFLQVADADDLPFGWKKAVSYVLTLEHPSGGNMSYAKRNPDKTFKMCPKAIDWGWSQFITSDKIQQDGFVQSDTLVVRASVTVKSSSVDIDLEDSELYLKCAVEEGKPDAVQLCLDQGASVNCQFKDDLYTPLHTACSANPSEDADREAANIILEGSMRVLELLLEKGADGNACNKWRETPLLIAANNGHKQAVEALLRHGADPSLCSEAGWSALTFAAHKGYDDIVVLLLKAGAPINCRVTEDASTPLHKACAGAKIGHLSAVRLLLDGNADVHALNKWRETPLLTAANHGQANAVEALLRAGADPCKCTDTGWSPLSIAAYKGHDDVVKLLLDEGAPTEEADPTLSALLQAATKGLPDTVELLLSYGADHTVTTKKGDTALSILVEQNLIDAAVEMVTEYKASIPRCSRDRKKVQRARLLINLRIKQQQRDGVDLGSDVDEEVSHLEIAPVAVEEKKEPSGKKNKKKKKSSAEHEAKAAEEALLMELEQEDAERHKQEEEANKKSAKKRKKKERDRQQKKEQEERRLEEERALEKKREKEQEERDAAERAERERLAAVRRKEEEEYRKRHREALQKQKNEEEQRAKQQQDVEKRKTKDEKNANKNGQSVTAQSKTRGSKSAPKTPNIEQQRPVMPASSAAQTAMCGAKQVGVSAANVPLKKRGWETFPGAKSEPKQQSAEIGTKVPAPDASTRPPDTATSVASLNGSQRSGPIMAQAASPDRSTASLSSASVASPKVSAAFYEPPAVALFRREKVSELLHRCSVARASSDSLGFVNETVMRKVVFRWIMRAAHDSTEYLDFLLPSWVDLDKLVTFFQRQFISESRKSGTSNLGSAVQSIEALKEAGKSMAHLCHNLAKDVDNFKRQVNGQLAIDWNDASVGMSVTEIAGNRGNSIVVVDWAKQSQTSLTSMTFSKLKDRYRNSPSRLLSAMFVAKVCFDAKQILVGETTMDFRLAPSVKARLASELSVSGEVWSDPFSALGGKVFWGQCNEIDPMFGGYQPFGRENGNDNILSKQGGSVVVLAPPDSLLASRYLRHIFDLLESGDQTEVPVSFAILLRSECLVDPKASVSINDLFTLEPRLRENGSFLSRVETLPQGRHTFFSEKAGAVVLSDTGSLFVLLQNSLGKTQYLLSGIAAAEIIRSMEPVSQRLAEAPALGTSLAFTPEAAASNINVFAPQVGFNPNPHAAAIPPSPIPSNPFASDFGSSAPASSSFGTDPSPAHRAPGARRGRLFDLVDDGVDDNMNDVDVVSGMLGNLNVDDLFQNSGSQEVDIEAISLMGIGGSPGPNRLNPRNSSESSMPPFR